MREYALLGFGFNRALNQVGRLACLVIVLLNDLRADVYVMADIVTDTTRRLDCLAVRSEEHTSELQSP